MGDVLGIENVQDPDQTYKLTADNVMKILAMTMRFRQAFKFVLSLNNHNVWLIFFCWYFLQQCIDVSIIKWFHTE